jgi:hypothetical protein
MNKKSVSLRALIVAHEKERRDIEQLVPLEVEILSCANTVERGTKLDGKHVKRLNKALKNLAKIITFLSKPLRTYCQRMRVIGANTIQQNLNL